MTDRNREALRQRIAYEAARLMDEHAMQDHLQALRKAAERLGVSDQRLWPKKRDVHAALLQQQRLFRPQQQTSELALVRREALAAMGALARFTPRLVGHALRGTADLITGAQLLLFAESPDEVVIALLDRGIPWQQRDRVLLYAGGERRLHPVVSVEVVGVLLEFVVLPRKAIRNPPLDPVTERPERGAGPAEVQAMLKQGGLDGDQRLEMGT